MCRRDSITLVSALKTLVLPPGAIVSLNSYEVPEEASGKVYSSESRWIRKVEIECQGQEDRRAEGKIDCWPSDA